MTLGDRYKSLNSTGRMREKKNTGLLAHKKNNSLVRYYTVVFK